MPLADLPPSDFRQGIETNGFLPHPAPGATSKLFNEIKYLLSVHGVVCPKKVSAPPAPKNRPRESAPPRARFAGKPKRFHHGDTEARKRTRKVMSARFARNGSLVGFSVPPCLRGAYPLVGWLPAFHGLVSPDSRNPCSRPPFMGSFRRKRGTREMRRKSLIPDIRYPASDTPLHGVVLPQRRRSKCVN